MDPIIIDCSLEIFVWIIPEMELDVTRLVLPGDASNTKPVLISRFM